MQMVKAKVIRGVYIRGVPYAEGVIVNMPAADFNELKSANYVVEAPEPVEAPSTPSLLKKKGDA